MAAPPKLKRISREDLTDLSPETSKGVEKLLVALNPFLSDVTGALDRRLTFGENFAAIVKDVDFTMPDDWIPIPFTTGARSWAPSIDPNFGVPAIRKRADGVCETRGLVRYSGTDALEGGFTVFNVPAGYAPPYNCMFVNGGYSYTQTRVHTAGHFTWHFGESYYLSLMQCSWEAADRRPPKPGAPFPLTVACDALPGKPGGVIPLRCFDVTSKAQEPAPLPGVTWELGTQGNKPVVRIANLTGLAPRRKYRLTLLVTV